LNVRPASVAAQEILGVINGLDQKSNGNFVDYRGEPLPW
jgi:hypothetical protein